MAPLSQTVTSKVKRPPGIITNGVHSSTSSPSPSMSASRLPSGAKYPPNSATSNGVGSSTSGPRSANRARRDAPGQLLGRGQRNSSVGLRSASIAGELAIQQVADPPPYIKTDEYILRRYRGNPPSLIVHLHPTHFRFDQQEGSFSYKSPMRLFIEHLRMRLIPHDLMEFFAHNNVEFYEGCMIVQVVDHKSTAPAQESIRTNSTTTKTVPFSVHNHNPCLTPSPWVSYPTENGLPGKGKATPEGDVEDAAESKSSEQKDKENMPAPAFPEGQRGKAVAQQRKPKVSTIVLHPTPISDNADLVIKAANSRSANASDPLSATVPPTPSTAIPQTPQTSMAPPAKRLKKTKLELDSNNLHAAASQIVLATTAPLVLDPVNNVSEAVALLDSLAHPMHSDKPPSPKTRKRTVAEMAADEEFAAAQERYMLIFDEKNAAGAQGGANTGDGDGQAGGASFEPRFERFKVLENIRNQLEENKKSEKARQQEAERKNLQDRERERLRQESEKKLEQERIRNVQMQQAAQQARLAQQEAAQRRMAQAAQQQSQQGMQGVSPQVQGQHAHPQPNVIMQNGIQGQPQRFHQQVSQAQISSPIVRNVTPQSHSSPAVNNLTNIPMQQSTSSMGGSPPRPGSVVNSQMNGPVTHGMTSQRSQQSHAGTPRMPSATPNVQSTPLNRQMSQTPRMGQPSPLQGSMAQAPQMPQQMMHNGQPMNLNSAQQQALHSQLQQQQAIMAQRMQRQATMAQGLQMNGQQMTPQQQQAIMQAQLLRSAQAQAQQGGNPSAQLAQNYQAQMAAMAQRTGGMPQNMNFNAPGMNMQQMQQAMQMQQMQQIQAQAQAQAHAQNQQHPQMNPQALAQAQHNAAIAKSIQNATQNLFQQNYPNLQAQYPNGVPTEAANNLRAQCQQQATQQVQNNWRARRQIQQHQQMLAAQQGGMNPNGMNGMGMQRPNGM